jgi:hypothetical protein
MSSLDQDEADKQLQRAVPWVSDPQHREQRDSETRRLQEDVIEAAKRLERESAQVRPAAESGTAVGFRLAAVRKPEDGRSPRAERVDSAEKARKIWDQLRTEFVSEPEQDGWGMRGLALAAAFVGALAVSAVVAMIVVNVVHPSGMLSADATDEERVAKGNSLALTTLGDLAKVAEVQAKMIHTDEPAAPTETLLPSAQPDDIAVPKPPAATSPKTATIEPATPKTIKPETIKPDVTTPAASPVPTASSAPEKPRPAALPQDEIAALLKRGHDLIAAGDIASARLVLTLVAEADDAAASFTLAETFDPAALAKLPAIGVRGDAAKARAWYARAAELGSLEARQRLQALR